GADDGFPFRHGYGRRPRSEQHRQVSSGLREQRQLHFRQLRQLGAIGGLGLGGRRHFGHRKHHRNQLHGPPLYANTPNTHPIHPRHSRRHGGNAQRGRGDRFGRGAARRLG